jgi:hypothetical protein
LIGLSVSTEWSYRGLRTVVLENRLVRMVILPEVGARIWQIVYKPLDAPLLWNNPRIAPARQPLNSRYDDVWSGGWDELFPNDEAATIDGEMYPDHGELWTGEWIAEPFQTNDEAGVRLRFTTPISAISVEKTIRIRPDSARVHFHHAFQNLGHTPFPFLWKLHPAMAVTPQHRVDFPRMKVTTEPAFPGTLGGGPVSFDWPGTKISGRDVDLRRVPEESERQLYFFYGTEMAAGWCALTNTANRLACGLAFDPKVFPSCWLFASYGGWRNYNVAVLEPCTGYPLNFESMRAAGRHRTLAPGEKLSTDVLLTLQEGITGVSAIEPDGTMVAR